MTTQHVSFLLHSSCYNVTDAHHFMRLVFTNLFWFKCETCNSAYKNVCKSHLNPFLEPIPELIKEGKVS